MDDGRGERAEAGADSFQMTTFLIDPQTGPVFYPLSPHVFITGVQVTSIFFSPLLCGQAKNTVYLNIPKKLKSLLKGQTVPQIVANVG